MRPNMKLFDYGHLTPRLQEIAKPFKQIAHHIDGTLQGTEADVALRKLLEAKDAAVRAGIDTWQLG